MKFISIYSPEFPLTEPANTENHKFLHRMHIFQVALRENVIYMHHIFYSIAVNNMHMAFLFTELRTKQLLSYIISISREYKHVTQSLLFYIIQPLHI